MFVSENIKFREHYLLHLTNMCLGKVRSRRKSQLSALAHNLLRSFQLRTLAILKRYSCTRTYTDTLVGKRTRCALLIPGAGSREGMGRRQVLRMTASTIIRALHERVAHA